MTTLLISAAALLGVLFLWGVISPRGQWNALVSWTRSEPRGSEPSAGAYAVGRFLSFVGLAVLTIIAAGFAVGSIDLSAPPRPPVPTLVQRVWGEPRSYVVDRVFTPLTAAPEGLTAVQVDGYQVIHPVERTPAYLFEAGKIRAAGLATIPGFLGVQPIPGAVALDTADIIVHVSADERCIPQQVVVIQAEAAVQVEVFFGLPPAAEGAEDPPAAEEAPAAEDAPATEGAAAEDAPATEGTAAARPDCDPSAPVARSRGYLIPVDLTTGLGARAVQTLAATEIPRVPVPR